MACHSDQALAILAEAATPEERAALGAMRYQPNRAVLHTDASVLPQREKAWAAWNYEAGGAGGEIPRVCLHYLINRLQPLPLQDAGGRLAQPAARDRPGHRDRRIRVRPPGVRPGRHPRPRRP